MLCPGFVDAHAHSALELCPTKRGLSGAPIHKKIATFTDYGVTYGGLGAAVGLLFYLYFSVELVLLGAEVNAATHSSGQDGSLRAEKWSE
jgi:hypothetical protein